MHDKGLDDLLSDDFLDSLGDEEVLTEEEDTPIPEGVPDDKEHTAYKAWKAILELKSEKGNAIKAYNQIANKKTPKSLYEIKKTEVGKSVGKSQQNLFYGKASFCKGLNDCIEDQNDELLELFEKEQEVLKNPKRVTGIRAKKKNEIVTDYQQLRETVELLRRKNAKETIDLVIGRMPLDLQAKLRSK
jgi:hypothetical protein